MRRIQLWFCALVAVAGLASFGCQATAAAEEERKTGVDERLERLERQVQQLAGRDGQGNQRPGPMMDDRPGQPPRDGIYVPLRGEPYQGREYCRVPMRRCPLRCVVGMVALVLAVVHVLLAVWVSGDIRKRGEGSWIFVVLAVLIGIPGAALYMLARIGDRKIAEQKSAS